MNIDERIMERCPYGSAMPGAKAEFLAHYKQLIKDVLAEVMPERPDSSYLTGYGNEDLIGYNNAINEMEAKIKELGL